jgi:hypothetical protein
MIFLYYPTGAVTHLLYMLISRSLLTYVLFIVIIFNELLMYIES